MRTETFPMTEEGLSKVKLELHQLETEKREHAKERIKRARSFCDFQEDSEYELALKALARIEDRVAHLQYMIQHVELIKEVAADHVVAGSTVTFKDVATDEQETYRIVGGVEADPSAGKISNQSEVAQSLLSATVDDKVTIRTPGGNREVIVTRIS